MSGTLLQKLRRDKEFALHDAYEPEVPAVRLGRILGSCRNAAAEHDDAGALKLYELALLAVDDVHPDDETRKAQRALTAIDLYRALPEFRKSRECVDRETYEMADVRNQTLVGLKKRILADVAARWSAAKTEDEANGLARFLVEVARKRDRHETERLTEALRDATKSVWKKERAIALMTRFLAETDVDGEQNPFRVLLVGVMRSFGRDEALSLATLLLHLPFDARADWDGLRGDAVMVALERDAETYRGMHDAMRELKAALKLPTGRIQSFAPRYWSQPPLVELDIGASKSFSMRGEEENDFHQLAHDLRDQVQAWRTAWLERQGETPPPALRIKLKIFQPVTFGEPRLVRTFSVG